MIEELNEFTAEHGNNFVRAHLEDWVAKKKGHPDTEHVSHLLAFSGVDSITIGKATWYEYFPESKVDTLRIKVLAFIKRLWHN
jgi:hypothetical protein